MYLAPQAGHAPHQVPLEWIDKYKGKFDQGYEAIRAEILARQIELGLLPEGTELSPINPHGEPERTGPDGQPWPQLDTVRPWDSLTADEQRLFARMAEVFAGYISYCDDQLRSRARLPRGVGSARQHDRRRDLRQRRERRGWSERQLQRVALLQRRRRHPDLTLERIDELGSPKSYNHYNTGWAWAFDTPFPYWKRWAGAEGGVADMCFVSWPAKIKADGRPPAVHPRGRRRADDLRAARHRTARGAQGLPAEPDRGRELRRVADRPERAGQGDAVLHDARPALDLPRRLAGVDRAPAAQRAGATSSKDEWELFHLETDRSQSKNVAADDPERLEALKDLWFYYAGIYNGLPLDDRTALEQILAERPHGGPDRDRYEYFPNCADVPESAGVAINGRSYTIAAGVSLDSADAEGVLYAHGGVAGGHCLYVKDKRLHYAFNWVGTTCRRSRRTASITAGQHVVAVEFVVQGPSTDPDMPGFDGTADALHRRPGRRLRRHRHPARLLLPRRRRHLRRARQRLAGHARLRRPRHLRVHRRHDRQGRRRRHRRPLRRPRGTGPRPGS